MNRIPGELHTYCSSTTNWWFKHSRIDERCILSAKYVCCAVLTPDHCPLLSGSGSFVGSRESPRPSCQDPNLWTVEDVMQFIRDIDPLLGPHADLFRKHVRAHHTKALISQLLKTATDLKSVLKDGPLKAFYPEATSTYKFSLLS